mgnify:CR=1 FL=1
MHITSTLLAHLSSTSSPMMVGHRAWQNSVIGFGVRVDDEYRNGHGMVGMMMAMNVVELMAMKIHKHCGVGRGA